MISSLQGSTGANMASIHNTQPVQQKVTQTPADLLGQEEAAVFEKSEEPSAKAFTYSPSKLTQEQVDAIEQMEEQRKSNELELLTNTVKQLTENQAETTTFTYNNLELETESVNILTDIFGSLENALPALATTPEEAAADIAEGGAYSVEAVSERIMTMATYFANGDMEVLAEMQDAVKEGFKLAGMDLETGEGMPEITYETYNHVMGSFDALLNPSVEPEVPAE